MLPVSGAEQFVASPSSGDVPITSHSGAYSRFERPGPCSALGQEEVPEVARARLDLQLLHDRRREVRMSPDSSRWCPVDRLRRAGRCSLSNVDEPVLQLDGTGARVRTPSPNPPGRPLGDRDPTLRPVTRHSAAPACACSSSAAFIAGPFAGQLLGDLGADVVKIEPPGAGDIMRALRRAHRRPEPVVAGDRPQQALGRDRPARRARARGRRARIAASCDVVLENFKPGHARGLGPRLRRRSRADNPGVVLVHVSGFGQTGPRAAEPGFGSIGEAMGGIRHTTGDPDRPPARTGVSIGDSLAGLFAVVGTLAARQRADTQRSGPGGRRRDLRSGDGADGVDRRRLRARRESPVTRSGGVLRDVAPANAYPTADGRDVVIAGNADAVFARLCDAMDRPDLARDLAYATRRGPSTRIALDDEIAAWTADASPPTISSRCCARTTFPSVSSTRAPDLAVDDPHIAAREMIVRLAAGFDARRPDDRRRAEVLAHAGIDPRRRARARRAHRRGVARPCGSRRRGDRGVTRRWRLLRERASKKLRSAARPCSSGGARSAASSSLAPRGDRRP